MLVLVLGVSASSLKLRLAASIPSRKTPRLRLNCEAMLYVGSTIQNDNATGCFKGGLELPVHCCGPISRPVSGRGTLTHAVALRLGNSVLPRNLGLASEAIT